MQYSGLSDFLNTAQRALATGPVALIFAEDDAELDTTLRHHQHLGFRTLVLLDGAECTLPDDLRGKVHHIRYDTAVADAVPHAVTTLSRAAAGSWMFYCYNAEFLFFPFCETRSVSELLAYHSEERRDAMLAYVVDLYAGDLNRWPNAVSLDDAWLDRAGYYAAPRLDPKNHNYPKERQLEFHGGLRWRFEEHVPQTRRKIDRVALFRARRSLRLAADHTFNIEEYNTYACPWHNNLSCVLASFRTAKALKRNPGSTYDIDTFRWRNSARFEWHSRQLLDLGLMEPGQWF